MREDIFTLDDGQQIVIQWPRQCSFAEAADLRIWLHMIVKKMERQYPDAPINDGNCLLDCRGMLKPADVASGGVIKPAQADSETW